MVHGSATVSNSICKDPGEAAAALGAALAIGQDQLSSEWFPSLILEDF